MRIKQDPVTGLWCREDGAVLLPPTGIRYRRFRWTFGRVHDNGYRTVRYKNKFHLVHRLICRAFHGLPPEGKPAVDHKNRIKVDNRPCNLHWASPKENQDNKRCVDQSIEKYGIRHCDNHKAYCKAYYAVNRDKWKARRNRT